MLPSLFFSSGTFYSRFLGAQQANGYIYFSEIIIIFFKFCDASFTTLRYFVFYFSLIFCCGSQRPIFATRFTPAFAMFSCPLWLPPVWYLHRSMVADSSLASWHVFRFFFLVRITWISVMVQKLYWFHYHISLIFLFFERYFICLHCGTFHHLFSAVLVKWESAASISGTQCPRFSLIIQNRQMTVCVCVCASGRRFTSSILGMNARIHYPDFHHLFKIGKKSGWFRDFFPQKLLTLAPSQAMWIAGRQELRGPSVPPLPRGHYSK